MDGREERDLREKEERSQIHDRNRSEFLSTASHEMRTPLTIIREFTNLMVDEVAGPVTAHQNQCLNSVLRNCDRLTSLLDDLLDLAKIESGKMALSRRQLDLSNVLRECADDFTPLLGRRSQSIALDIPPNLPAVLGDRSKIGQALVNLIGNSNKFTPDGGQIRITAFTEGMYVHVGVTDTGCGIDPGDLSGIFEAFAQLSHDEGSGLKGTGLGLNITRKIVELHDGVISILSAKGVGSTFGFTLPVYSEALEMEAFVQDQTRIVGRDSNHAHLIAVLAGHPDHGMPDANQMGIVRATADSSLGNLECNETLRTRGILIYIGVVPTVELKPRIKAMRAELESNFIVSRVEHAPIRPGCGARALHLALERLGFLLVSPVRPDPIL